MSSISALRAVRIAVVVIAVAGAAACADTSLQPRPGHDRAPAIPQTPVGTSHDFDFEHGRWRTTLRRLLQPLSGSQHWADYTGTSDVHPLLGGRANVVELKVAGPLGFIEGVSLRLFDTQRQRWTLNYSNVTGGTLELPMSGGFNGGRHGIFYSADMFGGKPILVRFVIDVLDVDHCRFEQAFSADGGATWEVNWIALDTRLS
ncbi:MAG: DUF1579 domain-containing protein [Rhizobacter sp.]